MFYFLALKARTTASSLMVRVILILTFFLCHFLAVQEPINKTIQNRKWRRIRHPLRRAQTSITRQALDSNLQRKRKRRRPALTRRRTLPVKMFTCHSCLLSFRFPRVSATRVVTIIGCVVIRFVFTNYCKKLKLKYFDTVLRAALIRNFFKNILIVSVNNPKVAFAYRTIASGRGPI